MPRALLAALFGSLPFAGAADLDRRVIRAVGDPNWRFQEDYLRILRALRFSARFDFRIQPRTLEAAKANVQGLAQLSAERVRDEWFKGVRTAKRMSRLFQLWREIGAARIWLPETVGRRDAAVPDARAVDRLPRDPVLVSAFLASDAASLLTRLKCATRDIERGRAFWGLAAATVAALAWQASHFIIYQPLWPSEVASSCGVLAGSFHW